MNMNITKYKAIVKHKQNDNIRNIIVYASSSEQARSIVESTCIDSINESVISVFNDGIGIDI